MSHVPSCVDSRVSVFVSSSVCVLRLHLCSVHFQSDFVSALFLVTFLSFAVYIIFVYFLVWL